MKKILKLTCCTVTAALCFGCLFGCSGGTPAKETTSADTDTTKPAGHSKVLFTMEGGKTFTVELYPEYAPETCANFLKLVNEGFYNGLNFHRVMKGFMAQGGAPGEDSPEPETIHGEFASNGYTANTLSHARGVISMARIGGMPNSASSQFFICYDSSCSQLDGDYAAFGKVVEGMETVDSFLDGEIAYNARGEKSQPVEPIIIKSAVVL